uniref:Uncharacterized protein n=1 Tax=Romanomermis culicivorax TaxID=13658 RepID=A0A915L831_ROMCU
MVELLETELQKLEETASKLDLEAREAIRAQNRPKAKQCLRQRKSVLNQVRVKEAALNNGMNLMNQLAQTKEQKQILDAFKAGVAAFKNDLAEHGISPDKVDETMDDVHEALSDQHDISEALARSPVPSSTMSA